MQPSGCTSPKKRFIESSSFYTNCQEKDPFSKMNIDDYTFLENVPSRSTCPKCNRSRKYYCYTCYVAVREISERLPVVSLPIKIDIIKHPKEVDGKSTAAHAAVLAPDDVTVYIYPDFPSYNSKEVLLVFPSETALPFHEWWNKTFQSNVKEEIHEFVLDENLTPPENLSHDCEKTSEKVNLENDMKFNCSLRKIIFIDSTWRQAKALYSDPRLQELPCVYLNDHKSLFWRYYRGKKDTHLSTIEAVYYFLVELYTLSCPRVSYDGHLDNMLFFFKFMYFKIRTLYDPLKLKAYQCC